MHDYGIYTAAARSGEESPTTFISRALSDWREEKVTDLQFDDFIDFVARQLRKSEEAS